MKHVGGFEGSKEVLGFLSVPLAALAHIWYHCSPIQFFHLLKLITNRWAGYKVGGARQCSSMRRYPWQPCERPPPHRHTEQFSGILTDQYLTGPHLKREGGMGKNQSTKWLANSKLSQQHFAKNFKQTSAYISHEVPLLEASVHPQYSWKNCWPVLLNFS